MNISERIVFVMSIKYAQRRSVESIANQIELSRDVVLDRLLELQSRKLVRRWTDGGWALREPTTWPVTALRPSTIPRSKGRPSIRRRRRQMRTAGAKPLM
jgi:hypothetical protein